MRAIPSKRIQDQTVPQAQRLRRTADFFPLPRMRPEAAISVFDRTERFLVPEMCQAELQKPAADKGRNGRLLEGNGIRKEISDPPAVAYRWIFFFGFSSRQAKGDARNNIPPPSGPFLPISASTRKAADGRSGPDMPIVHPPTPTLFGNLAKGPVRGTFSNSVTLYRKRGPLVRAAPSFISLFQL